MSDGLDDIRADAVAPSQGVTVVLATENGKGEITVPPAGRWKTRANTMLRDGNLDGWAQITLSAEDWATWSELDPTNDDAGAFFAAWQEAAGETVGKSSKSPSGSRPTPRQ